MKDFKTLIHTISAAHNELQKQAVNAVNFTIAILTFLVLCPKISQILSPLQFLGH